MPFAPQEPVGQAAHLASIEECLANPQLIDPLWRLKLWANLGPLEHNDSPLVLSAWEALATSNTPTDRANLLLYQRRHDLNSKWDNPLESSEVALEWALGLWGRKEFKELSRFLEEACTHFPNEKRLRNNRLWFEGRGSEIIPLGGTPREMALTILTQINREPK
jgi:hypothetical protein